MVDSPEDSGGDFVGGGFYRSPDFYVQAHSSGDVICPYNDRAPIESWS